MSEELANIFGLSLRLRIPRRWLTDEADAGRIPYLQTGCRRLFNVGAVRNALAERAARLPVKQESAS